MHPPVTAHWGTKPGTRHPTRVLGTWPLENQVCVSGRLVEGPGGGGESGVCLGLGGGGATGGVVPW